MAIRQVDPPVRPPKPDSMSQIMPPTTSTVPPSTMTAGNLKAELAHHLGHDLKHVNQILLHKLRSSSELVTDVTQHVSRFQGKQIRPVLVLLFERMVAGNASPSGHTLAASIEMIHMATLVHDDLIDGAETRRHVATVHQRWNAETSVLFGDYLFSKSFHLAASTGDAEACRLIGLATDRTCEGELNQSAARTADSPSELEYFRIIRDKTGQLFGLSCLLGVRAAGGTLPQQQAARRFGIRLGSAFQIADDLLDLTGDASTTGKDTGNDLENNRFTLPLLRAFKAADQQERAALSRAIATGADSEHLRELACVRLGIQSAAATAADLVSRAVHDLRCFNTVRERSLLEAIARFSVSREQ
ncbi:MAG: polyprenyl synthetase family protein [Planctomycetaceae bacterium]|nr:polyprenyl synthetase family protein [Planctomycetaceae bacterium]